MAEFTSILTLCTRRAIYSASLCRSGCDGESFRAHDEVRREAAGILQILEVTPFCRFRFLTCMRFDIRPG